MNSNLKRLQPKLVGLNIHAKQEWLGKKQVQHPWGLLKNMKHGEIYADGELIYKNGEFTTKRKNQRKPARTCLVVTFIYQLVLVILGAKNAVAKRNQNLLPNLQETHSSRSQYTQRKPKKRQTVKGRETKSPKSPGTRRPRKILQSAGQPHGKKIKNDKENPGETDM